jgi:glycosyltransferase involved in cell wall biosynthesis
MVTIYNPLLETDGPRSLEQRAGTGRYEVLYAGNISHAKGTHLLVEALPLIHTTLNDKPVHATLAGEGPLRADLEGRVAELGMAGQVDFTGRLPYDELQRLYRQADVVVVPSVVQEAFGRVALEALMNGTPAVVSNRGGLSEIVEDEVTGLVVDPEPRRIAQAVVRVLRSPTMRRQVYNALPDLRRKFGSDVTSAHIDIYSRLLTGRPLDLAAPGIG